MDIPDNARITIDLDHYMEITNAEDNANLRIERWKKAMQGIQWFMTILARNNPEIFSKAQEEFNESNTGSDIIQEDGRVKIKISWSS